MKAKNTLTEPARVMLLYSNVLKLLRIGSIMVFTSLVILEVKWPEVVPSKNATSWPSTLLNILVRTANKIRRLTTPKAAL